MNKSDKYYIKNGRLDLSMLEDEVELTHTETTQEGLREESCLNQELKIDQEICRTLHVMGKFLTKANFTPSSKTNPNHQIISKEDKVTEINQKVNLHKVKKYYLNC